MNAEKNIDRPNEPLASRLRNAALERTTVEAQRVDDFVLDADGVIDLRDLERDPLGSSVADPAKALATIRGQLGDAHEVAELYDESEPDRSRWRLGLRARHAFGQASTTTVAEKPATTPPAPDPTPTPAAAPTPTRPPLSRLSMVPVAPEPEPAAETETNEVAMAAEVPDPAIDLRDEERPTANCPKCMGLAHRDLFDRFSQVEFYSCDNCMHMWQQDVT